MLDDVGSRPGPPKLETILIVGGKGARNNTSSTLAFLVSDTSAILLWKRA